MKATINKNSKNLIFIKHSIEIRVFSYDSYWEIFCNMKLIFKLE